MSKNILLNPVSGAFITLGLLATAFLVYANTVTVTTQVIVTNATPTVDSVAMVDGAGAAITDIDLVPNDSTDNAATPTGNVVISTVISDPNGCADVTGGTVSAVFHAASAGETDPSTCTTADDLDCYEVTCTVDAGTNTCGVAPDDDVAYTCEVPLEYIASDENWTATVFVDDGSATDTGDSTVIAVNQLKAIAIDGDIDTVTTFPLIDYGSVAAGATSAEITKAIENVGNVNTGVEVDGTNLDDGPDETIADGTNTIAVGAQEYDTATFVYGAGTDLTTSAATITGLTINSATTTATASTQDTLWQIEVPSGTPSGTYKGQADFTAI